ncbi:GTP 3',8-cyclase MoaA [Arthrobacter sp. ISL-72]|uniref:GTP 3',8-cyclase MoaA n=1 Tax=Arthrobacter sp. ISL-72 TaxID=2819114 RepID=UPI001BE7CF21|nr:GTP 3',8-cyclase MoaA [Arthrobacter sp. ISL-72]MBT2593813.1 GTP 3',8-cyclase MoaA [Arthrobacter sp. ISL-72]
MTVQLGIPVLRAAPDGRGPAPEPRPPGLRAGLVDRFGRQATDMRLSVTDKCNLRCTYCMPAEGLQWLSKQAVMTAGEIVRIVGIGVERLGVRELRLTGGEPLVRPDLAAIIAALREHHPDLPISMTTNGVGLDRKAQALKETGLTRINVSLDSLHEETFTRLTRRPFLSKVLAGVEAARAVGLGPLKINAVLMRGINDHEAAGLLAWALEHGFELRFIEQMPLDADHGWTRRAMITADEIHGLLSQEFCLRPDPRARDGAPAARFQVRRRDPARGEATGPVLGTAGIIASVTEPFCSDCRRTRITAEGKIMSCLFSREEFDLLGLLREGADDDELAVRWQDAMWVKPRAHGMDHGGLGAADFIQPDRSMSAIGG